MTGQIPDKFIYNQDEYDLIGIEGGELFHPSQLDMEPMFYSTACWRGFVATYEIINNVIYLDELRLMEANNNYKKINGVEPEFDDNSEAFYRYLKYKLNFTGKIRLAKDFISEFYVHMGFQKPTAFKTVIDLKIENGNVILLKDRSEEVKRIRGEFKRKYITEKDVFKKIEEAFDLSMDLE